MAGAYLVDDNALCNTRYKSGNCTACTATCVRDNLCISNCPNYYFPVSQTNVASLLGYKYFWDTHFDRLNSSICELCDYRCRLCTGPTNLDCSACVDNYFKWTTQTYCTPDCPDGEFQGYLVLPAPRNITECVKCNTNCLQCIWQAYNCSVCVGPYDAANSAYLYRNSTSLSTCVKPCPASTSNLTIIGFYGSVVTMTCMLCPSPCSNCDLSMYIANPALGCDNSSCLNVLRCTSCLSGFTMVQGKCISNSACREYARYMPAAGATTWSSTACVCLDGYYLAAYVSCSICDDTCMTCRASGTSGCTSCPYGYNIQWTSTANISGSCTMDALAFDLGSFAGTTAPTGIFSSSGNGIGSCGTSYLFGFNNTAATNYL
jgi:hypothetical protein